jgi:murein DD-endopeptidase MepM/ murein hydrolase activator NlpD
VTYLRRALSGTPVDAPAPVSGNIQAPIYPLEVGAHGAWLEVRSSPADGACGVHGYPCKHPGVDVAGVQGTTVVAPESGTIVAVGDGASAPFVGYGPWFAIIQGDGGKFHFLGHLDPSTAGMGLQGAAVTAGDPVGTTSSANHTHWEVRTRMVPDFANGEDNFSNNSDPLAWLASQDLVVPLLLIGAAALLIYLAHQGS